MKKQATLLLGFILLVGCTKDLDFDKMDNVQMNPDVNVPLVNATLSLEILAKQDSALVVDADNALHIAYKEDSIFEYGVAELLEIPNQEAVEFPLVKGNAPYQVEVGLGTIGKAEFDNVVFHEGYLRFSISVNNSISSPSDIQFSIYNAQLNGDTLSEIFTLPANQTQMTDSIDISGMEIDFTGGGTKVNYLDVNAELVSSPAASVGMQFNCSLGFSGLQVDEAQGYFGNRMLPPFNGSFDFDISGLKEFAGGFFLTDPEINLIAESSVGLPVKINPDFEGVNLEKNYQSLNSPDFDVQSPSSIGGSKSSVLSINANNSSVVDFMANLPQKVLYGAEVRLNPQGRTGTPNFVDRSSKVVVGFEADVPMELKAQNMQLKKTLKDVQLSQEDNPDLIEELGLTFNIKNGFPFDLTLDVTFVDSVSGDSLHGFQIDLLTAARTDAQGTVTEATETQEKITFTNDQIESLLTSDNIRFKARLNTPNNGQDVAKLYADYELGIKISTQTKLKAKP